MFYELPIVTLKIPLEQNYIGKCSKEFEASDFPACILNNTHFFWYQSQKSNKFHDVRIGRNVPQTKWYMQKVPFDYDDFVYQTS